MKNDDLEIYLNDHLAGSVAAISLLDRIVRIYEPQPLAQACNELKQEIETDQEVLRQILKALEIDESTLRKAGAWIAEKLSRAKLELERQEKSGVGLVQALEALILGIKGKELLWGVLSSVKTVYLELRQFDFLSLARQAIEQQGRVETLRIRAAVEAFQPRAADQE